MRLADFLDWNDQQEITTSLSPEEVADRLKSQMKPWYFPWKNKPLCGRLSYRAFQLWTSVRASSAAKPVAFGTIDTSDNQTLVRIQYRVLPFYKWGFAFCLIATLLMALILCIVWLPHIRDLATFGLFLAGAGMPIWGLLLFAFSKWIHRDEIPALKRIFAKALTDGGASDNQKTV